jgi:hypothetical protein
MIVTSFSKKQVNEVNQKQSPFRNSAINSKKMSEVDSPSYKKTNARSEYYIKTAETKT